MKSKLTLAATILSASLVAGGAYAMQEMDSSMPMQGKHSMMMEHKANKIDKVEGLSDASKGLLKNAMKANMDSKKEIMEAMKKHREEMKAIMSAEQFDKKAFLAKKDEMAALKTKMQTERAQAMADVYEKMTAQERQAWANHTMEMGMGMKRGHKNGGKGMGMMGSDKSSMDKDTKVSK